MPRGNFYYYFKSKDAILAAVIERRTAGIRAMLDEWRGTVATPRERLKRFVRILDKSQDDILRYGCPMGSLTVELSKTQLQQQSHAREMFEAFRTYLVEQFRALGHVADADALALHMLALTQGVSLMGNVYTDAEFLRREAAQLDAWLDRL